MLIVILHDATWPLPWLALHDRQWQVSAWDTNVDWVPVVFIAFKAIVFVTGMFLAIKWHYDQGKKGRPIDKRALLRTAGKVAAFAAVFVVLLWGLLHVVFAVSKNIGLNLT